MKYSSRFVIITGFTLVLLLLLLIIATSLNNMSSINDRMDKIVNIHNLKVMQMSELRSIARERSLLFYHMLMVRDPFLIDENIQKASNYAGEFIKIKDELFAASSSSSEKQKLDQMMESVTYSTRIQQQVIQLLLAGKFEQASQIFVEQSLPAQKIALEHYDRMLSEHQQFATEAAQEAKVEYQRSYIFMLLLSGIVIAVGAVISIYTVRRTSNAEKSLHELNMELEQRVEDRTHTLSEVNINLEGTIQALRDTQRQLIQVEKMASLGSLVAGISHEINTPLGIGVTAASSLQEEIDNIQKLFENGNMKRSDLEHFFVHANQAGDMLFNNMERARNLIHSFKQVAVDQSSDEWRILELHSYFAQIITSLGPKFKQTAVTVENCADMDLQTYTHPGAIYQIISNLTLNALLHAYDEGQAGVICVGARRDGDFIELTCQDNGKGIAEQNLGRIFEPFFTTRRGSGGTGLGLNIVYNLVSTRLGGVINVVSEIGTGTTFTVRLPVHQP